MTLWALSILLMLPQGFCEEPFWRAKEKIYQRVVEDFEIIVSVSSLDIPLSEKKQLKMVGGGRIATPVDYAYRRSLNFAELAEANDYIKKVKYDESSKLLELDLEAYGNKMNLVMQVTPKLELPRRSIEFLVQTGPLKGLIGVLDFRAVEAKGKNPQNEIAEVGFSAHFEYNKLPIPALFVRFGIEVVLKRVAFRIRQKFEREFRS